MCKLRYIHRCIENPAKHLNWSKKEPLAKIIIAWNYFPKTLHYVWRSKHRWGFKYVRVLNKPKSVPFDTINHELLAAKLHAYGFSIEVLEVLWSFLQERWQRVEINTTFSSRTQLLHGNPQGSVLGPMLFNIYINDMFFALNEIDICNFADDTTL